MSLAELLPLVENLTEAEKLQLIQVLNRGRSGQSPMAASGRIPGQDKGKVIIADDFDAALPDEILDGFENSELIALS